MATQCSEAYPELDIHLSDSCDAIVARNFLIVHIIFSNSFHPEDPTDMHYLWSVWYGTKWTDYTRKRFVGDATLVMQNMLTYPSIISNGSNFYVRLNNVLRKWIATVVTTTLPQTGWMLRQRWERFILFLNLDFLLTLNFSYFIWFS